MQQKVDQVYVEGPVEKMLAVPSRLKKVNGSSFSSQLRDTFVDSAVTIHSSGSWPGGVRAPRGTSSCAPYNTESLNIKFTDEYICFHSLFWSQGDLKEKNDYLREEW